MESYAPSSAPATAEELTAYIGPRAERYRPRFERFNRTGTTRFELSWNNPAAFLGLWWYLYRKMYMWALVDFVLSVLLGWTLFVPILWGVARAVTGDYLYFLQADRRIREARPISSVVRRARRERRAPRPARRRGRRQRLGHVGRHRRDHPASRHPPLRLRVALERDPAATRTLARPPGPLDVTEGAPSPGPLCEASFRTSGISSRSTGRTRAGAGAAGRG